MPSIPQRPLYLLVPEGQMQPLRTDGCDADDDCSDTSGIENSRHSAKHSLDIAMPAKALLPSSPDPKDDEDAIPPGMVPLDSSTSTYDDDEEDSDSERIPDEEPDKPLAAQEQQQQHLPPASEEELPAPKTPTEPPATCHTKPSCLVTTTKKKKKNLHVEFEAMSTLYVFEDDYKYDCSETWYSQRDLKAFRADAFLTVNWMVTHGIGQDEDNAPFPPPTPRHHRRKTHRQLSKTTASSSASSSTSCTHDPVAPARRREMQAVASQARYEFCARGVECRTPMGRWTKHQRRLDALRVVLLYQQLQKQHRRTRRRERRRREQQQYGDNDDAVPSSYARPTTTPSDPEALRRIEAEIDAQALAEIYGAYCQESASEALELGTLDALEAGSVVPSASVESSRTTNHHTTSSSSSLLHHPYDFSRSQPTPFSTGGSSNHHHHPRNFHDCPSLCDEDDIEEEDDDENDAFMDKLVSLSFVDHNDDSESDEDSTTNNSSTNHGAHHNEDEEEGSTTSSVSSTSSSSSYSVAISVSRRRLSSEEETVDRSVASDFSLQQLRRSRAKNQHSTASTQADEEEEEDGSSVVVEVELLEGDRRATHRIHCGATTPSPQQQPPSDPLPRWNQRAWPHRSAMACSPLGGLEASPPSSPTTTSSHRVSSLELGGLLLAITGLEWW